MLNWLLKSGFFTRWLCLCLSFFPFRTVLSAREARWFEWRCYSRQVLSLIHLCRCVVRLLFRSSTPSTRPIQSMKTRLRNVSVRPPLNSQYALLGDDDADDYCVTRVLGFLDTERGAATVNFFASPTDVPLEAVSSFCQASSSCNCGAVSRPQERILSHCARYLTRVRCVLRRCFRTP